MKEFFLFKKTRTKIVIWVAKLLKVDITVNV